MDFITQEYNTYWRWAYPKGSITLFSIKASNENGAGWHKFTSWFPDETLTRWPTKRFPNSCAGFNSERSILSEVVFGVAYSLDPDAASRMMMLEGHRSTHSSPLCAGRSQQQHQQQCETRCHYFGFLLLALSLILWRRLPIVGQLLVCLIRLDASAAFKRHQQHEFPWSEFTHKKIMTFGTQLCMFCCAVLCCALWIPVEVRCSANDWANWSYFKR